MKNSLWVIIVIVVGFTAFLIGYSRPHPAKVYGTSSSMQTTQQTAMTDAAAQTKRL